MTINTGRLKSNSLRPFLSGWDLNLQQNFSDGKKILHYQMIKAKATRALKDQMFLIMLKA